MAIDIIKISNSSVALIGKLEFATVNQAEKIAKSLVNFQQDLTIDCAKLDHCDSAGIALLVNWDKSAKLKKVKLSFVNFSKQMLQLVNLMRLQSIFLSESHGN